MGEKSALYGTISDVDGTTPLTDKTLIDRALSPGKEIKAKEEEQKLIRDAYSSMHGALIRYEASLKELRENYSNLTERQKNIIKYSGSLSPHHDRVRTMHKEAEQQIKYLLASPQVSLKMRTEALRAFTEYKNLSPSERRKEFTERYPIEDILGYRKPWE